MKKVVLAVLVLAALALGGCAGQTTVLDGAPGLLFADYRAGLDAEGPVGGKTGEACTQSILGWIGLGDSSIETAAKNGGITTVTSVDRRGRNILGLYAEYCTVVKGK